MRNITVSVDEETHRLARIRAAELDTSVSALVRGYLRRLVDRADDTATVVKSGDETETERRHRALRTIIEDITADGGGLRMVDNLPRHELYDRAKAREEAAVAVRGPKRN